MILRNLKTIDNHLTHLFLHEEGRQFELHFNEALVIPGLVNSHDHLDFNLFPQLGERKYKNYTEWGRHIHRHHKKEISQVLKVPKHLRTQWGLYKNLLCGVTTVVHHGPRLEIQEPLINVHQQSQSIHSVHFEKWWKWKLNNPQNKKKTCVVHTGEGTDELASNEIDQLLRWNMLNRPLVGIHGVAMRKEQAAQFAGLVWCPVSNDFLFGRTAPVEEFDTTLLFGSDSTLTSSWNIWDHIRFAREQCRMRDYELFNMLTVNAATTWGLPGYGENNKLPTDLVIAQTHGGQNMMDRFFEINPASILLVIRSGRIVLFDESLRHQLLEGNFDLKGFYRVALGSETKWVGGNLPKLIQSIKKYHPHVTLPVQESQLIAEP